MRVTCRGCGHETTAALTKGHKISHMACQRCQAQGQMARSSSLWPRFEATYDAREGWHVVWKCGRAYQNQTSTDPALVERELETWRRAVETARRTVRE